MNHATGRPDEDIERKPPQRYTWSHLWLDYGVSLNTIVETTGKDPEIVERVVRALSLIHI